MKKIFGKNQVIVTVLAIVIAVVGYYNYMAKTKKAVEASNDTYDAIYEDDQLISDDGTIESLDEQESETTGEIGEAVYTNGVNSTYMTKARLEREQTRSKNKETLLEVINNEGVSDNQKKTAVKEVTNITNNMEMENNIESLLKAKGFSDIVVTINKKQADVVVNEQDATDEKRAQIVDVIKRKTKVKTSNITITPTKDN